MFKKIIAPIDGSQSSIKALDYAAHLANQEKAELSIITAAEPLPPLAAQGSAPTYIPEYQEKLHKNLEQMQTEQLHRLAQQYPDLHATAEVIDGRATQVIKEASKDADLIVIGHRGQGGIITWLLGSTAKQVVDTCTAPVLVVKDTNYCKP